jgi:UDP-glucose 4-epimerase
LGTYLVTGGAGFVGSHAVLALIGRGDQVVVLDNLSTGHRGAVVPPAVLVTGDLDDHALVTGLFAAYRFDAVLHFASLSLVGESMREPLVYCARNTSNAFHLARSAIAAGCARFVLSSTANIYGEDVTLPITEDAPVRPSSPYGESKLMVERGLSWAARLHGLAFTALRYFNAAGADPGGRLGEHHDPETHLIPRAIDAALGRGPPLVVFGQDYSTPDGTCLRDYVHVDDLADAHLRVLDHAGGLGYCNVGAGAGYSVREVLAAVERVGGRPVPWEFGSRRLGDPPALVASAARLQTATGWRARLSGIDRIVADAWRWREGHPFGYGR